MHLKKENGYLNAGTKKAEESWKLGVITDLNKNNNKKVITTNNERGG